MSIEIDNKDYPIINKINMEDIMLDFKNRYVYVPILMTKSEFEEIEQKYITTKGYQNVELAWDEADEILQDIEAGVGTRQKKKKVKNVIGYLEDFVRPNMVRNDWMTYYIIQHRIDKELYWSNKNGWVNRRSADIFDSKEKSKYTLPIDSWWVELKW